MLAAGGAMGAMGGAHAQNALSAGWMAQKNLIQNTALATGRLPNGMAASSLVNPQAQSQQARAQLQRSVTNLGLAAQAIAAQQAAQAAARQAALNGGGTDDVPDGLGEGGLAVDTNSLTAGWLNANAPVQTQAGGRTNVAIQQTADKAILNWESFNVGKNTTLQFQQQPDWAVLNRVNDPLARPSRIQGQIKADGTVLIVNRNGIVFSGSSQIDTRNLVAAAARIDDIQFTAGGLYGPNQTPSFTDALGKVEVQAGAQIATREPASVKDGGGYVLLMGTEVNNAGQITTRKGQVQLAAGDSFIIRQGVGTEANTGSTTRGNEVSPQFSADSGAGKVANSGLLLAREGDITLAGRDVQQNGVAVATTTVNQRGTVHLLNSAADTAGRVALGAGATTAVVIEDDGKTTALDSQRDALIATSALIANAATGAFDNLSDLADRRDQSRIEIVSGGDVTFQGDSLTLATGGQIAVSAKHRSFVADGAQLDVSGAVGVNLSMESNNVKINVQGNEQRDAPLNRDSGNLLNANVWIDRRKLVYVPAGTGGYESDRWYTAGGLLEVGGYLGNQGHGIGEWAAQGGTVVLGGNEVITQAGSRVNLSGGSLNVQTGYLNQTWLKGSDGQLYNVNDAPADIVYTGVYQGFEDEHKRWGKGTTAYFYNPLIAPQRLLQNGYTVGRDAGRLIVSAPTVVLEGDITADVFNGAQQTGARSAGLGDGYKQPQGMAALPGTLALVGQWSVEAANWLTPFDTDVRLGEVEQITRGLAAGDALAADRTGTAWLDSAHLSAQHLGGLEIATLGDITVGKALTLQPGGTIRFSGAAIDIGADLIARGGTVSAVAEAENLTDSGEPGESGKLTLHSGATIDTRGLWTNARLDPSEVSGLAYLNGGAVSLSAAGDLSLEAGSLIDTSAGAAILADGKSRGGAGGDISLSSSLRTAAGQGDSGSLAIDGELRAFGFSKGGALTLRNGGAIVIGDAAYETGTTLPAGTPAPVDLTLAQDLIVRAGTPFPFSYSKTLTRLAPGDVLPGTVTPPSGLVLGAAWTVPENAIGTFYLMVDGFMTSGVPGTVFPAGAAFTQNGSLPAGYVLPADAFPDGIALSAPITASYAQGAVLANDVTLSAGAVIPQGARLGLEARIEAAPVLHLDPNFFGRGFSKYTLNGESGLIVAAGTAIAPTMPLLRLTEASKAVATGQDPAGTLERFLAPVYTEDPGGARLTQRAGVDLELRSGIGGATDTDMLIGGGVSVEQGASIEVDPGHGIGIASGGQIAVDGALTAPGGSIAVINRRPLGGKVGTYAADPGALSVWIGEHALLDVSARAYTAVAADGRRYGVVPDGGTIVLGSEGGLDDLTQGRRSSDAAVVVRPGARLDASGATAVFDGADGRGPGGPAFTAYTIASDGGSISANSYNALYLEGDLRAAAGGQGAAGGSLSLTLEAPAYTFPRGEPDYVPADLRAGRVLTVGQDYMPSGLAADLSPGVLDPNWKVGQARIGADQITAAGFDSVSLWGRSGIAFDGDVTLNVGRSLTLLQGPIYNTLAGGRVRLEAPYLLLDGATTVHQPPDSYLPVELPAYPSGGSLTASADLIDVRNTVQSFYDSTQLSSRGDLRFLASNDVPLGGLPTTRLTVPAGHLDLTARQLYPTTGAIAEVSAGISVSTDGNGTVTFAPDSVLTIGSIDGTVPALPSSVFGSLSLAAPIVRQGGIVRAPLGAIMLGQAGSSVNDSLTELLPGSITSISAAGLVVPYGGTTDGIRYTVDGSEVLPLNLIDGKFAQSGRYDAQGITLNGTHIVGREGSRLDLSGGGTLTGAAFVSGRGGSVDALVNPLTPGGRVYAIVPGMAATAPPVGGAAEAWTGDVPGIGEQITIGAGVPGLPAGTYALLPANYALLPGAYRIELGAQTVVPQALPTLPLRNGSYALSGVRSVADTAIRDSATTAVTVTPGAVLRTYSQYDEQSYDAFQIAKAATAGTLRPLLAADAKSLTFGLNALPTGSMPTLASALVFDGSADFSAGPGGYAGSLLLQVDPNLFGAQIVITGPGSTTERTDTVTTVPASALASVGAPSLFIGARPIVTLNSSSLAFGRNVESIRLEGGAVLRGAQVVLSSYGLIALDSGARIDTLGQNAKLLDSSAGYLFGNDPTPYPAAAFLIASNGQIALNTPSGAGDGMVTIADGASIYSEGTIGFYADKGVRFEGTPLLGTRNLALSLPSINIGEAGALAAAQTAGTLPAGLDLDQGLLDRLLAGSKAEGVPALEKLVLGATQSINFYGAVDLNLVDAATGAPLLQQLVLNTPAIYGAGSAGDTARLTVDTLVWNGKASPVAQSNSLSYESAKPGAVIAGGPGTGEGTLEIDARDIVFGYPEESQPIADLTFNRLMLGFASAELHASDRITANGKSSLSVYAAAGADPSAGFDPASYAGSGGALNLVTPLLTGDAGSVMSYYAGGAMTVAAPAGAVANATTQGALGAEINLHADSIAVSSAIVLPSGRLTLTAAHDIALAEGSTLDLSGRSIPFFDVTRYSWGGDVALESTHGNIVQAAGAVIDLSAQGGDAGTLQLTATDEHAGQVLLQGTLHGQGGDGHAGGSIDLRAQRIGADAGSLSGDFAALNTRLNAEGFVGARAFDLKQGDLRIGDEVRAQQVDISVDGGSLQVDGRIDASGTRPGSIRLSARDDLTLASGAVLDAHGTALQVDSYGQPIEAKNRGSIGLASSQGWLTLSPGATLELSSPDGVARGKVELDAGRTGETSGDIRIAASGPLAINGAGSVAVNGVWTYSPTDADGSIVQDNGDSSPVGADGSVGLKQIDQRSRQFIDAALVNGDLRGRLAGLAAYGDAFHLQPGVEIDSKDTPGGNLTVKGDLDLSGYRYGPNADRDPASATYGAGEAGQLVIRAAGDLTVKGSINDGFGLPPGVADGYGNIIEQNLTLTADRVIGAAGTALGSGSMVPTNGSLNFDFATIYAGLVAGKPIPFEMTAVNGYGLPPGTLVSANVYSSDGSLAIAAGTLLTDYFFGGGGDRFEAGFMAPDANLTVKAALIPRGTDLSFLAFAYADFTPLPAGAVLPAGTQIVTLSSESRRIWAVAPMLAAGSQSWSMRLAGGADVAAADTRTLQAASLLGSRGNLRLSDLYTSPATGTAIVGVLRTGTGDLDLLAGGNFSQDSAYGIYTAGTQTHLGTGDADYEAMGTYYPDHGGDLRVAAQGSLSSFIDADGDQIVHWLRRQGSNEDGIKTAWSINFGAYVTDPFGRTTLQSFEGFGALGGGNVSLLAGKDAGNLESLFKEGNLNSTALVVAVGSTGRVTSVTTAGNGVVTGGTLAQTGGGDITVKIGGRLNALQLNFGDETGNGVFTALRGDIRIDAGALGAVPLGYGMNELDDPRAIDPYRPTVFAPGGPLGGVVVVPGDGNVSLRTRGDLVLGGAGDAGQVEFQSNDAIRPWFTLWQPTTSIDLFSAGGNLTPSTSWKTRNENWSDGIGTFDLNMLPARFSATAASGSIYYGGGTASAYELVPSAWGRLELLAQDSIYAGAQVNGTSPSNPAHFLMSGANADLNSIPNPFKPATRANATQLNQESGFFAFEPDTATDDLHAFDPDPIRVFAVKGDIVNVVLGQQNFRIENGVRVDGDVAAKAAQVRAGRDIVGFGNGHSQYGDQYGEITSVILNTKDSDVSIISAGRDILHANVAIAGPGTLEISAGRNFYQGDNGGVTSIGPIMQGDESRGASIALQAGVGAAGPDYAALAARYLDPVNLADPALALAGQSGKVVKTYEAELGLWLKARYGFEGTADEARTYFAGLAPEQQRVFLRQVYYAELTAGGREYNDPDSKRYGSYLRGRDMIATLFPNQDAGGGALAGQGDITMFGGAGVRTLFGGDIEVLAPGGEVIVGVQGQVPPASSGLVTQGDGDISIYSKGSVLLGLSRIMTTFGGDILAWSAEGDINAGRGSKTTLVYTPPKREYDENGNVKLSSNVPSTGAGIATLAPIAEVPAGDVDLIAPLGTIDAGEAGIRVSGNVNLAALQVVNAANIEVKGESKGLPVVASVNTNALTSASAAASQATVAAQDVVQQQKNAARQALPSIFTVQVLGFGNEAGPARDNGNEAPPPPRRTSDAVRYDSKNLVQVIGLGGAFDPVRSAGLTDDERHRLLQDR